MKPAEAELAELIAAVLDGTASAAQHRRLAELLRANPELRADYVRQMRVDTLLNFIGGAKEQNEKSATTPASAPRRRFPRLLWAAAAAALLLVAALGWMRRGAEVEILAASGAAQTTWTTGSTVRVSRLAFAAGSLRLRLTSGVVLDVFGPLEMQVVDAMRVRVTQGHVTAEVAEGAKGFVVETAQAQVVDLGTKFGVAVEKRGHTDVVVFQGEVELFDRNSTRRSESRMARLIGGEAVRVDARQQMSRIVSVTSGAREEEWSTQAGTADSSIASVRDNLRDPAARNYYRILAGGLREDARAFVGKRHEWNGLDAAGIPPELLGADLVQTFVNDRSNSDLEITVTVSRPAIVYVLADSRRPAPSWLAAGFTNTGARIGLENAPLLASGKSVAEGPGAGNMAPFAVWKRELPQGGALTLGPPRDSPDQVLLWMYGIAVKPL